MMNESIEKYQLRHETVLHDLLDSTLIPAPRLKDAMFYTLFPGGKRFRPLLVYLCGELIGVNLRCLDIIAAAIELMHCYSLVHDDLPAMDNDDLRRGKPSCHRAFDEATAILVGDGMQAMAVDILLTHLPHLLPLPQVIQVTQTLIKACGPAGMVSGQSLDLSELTNPNITEQLLRDIHMLKTGQLMIACIDMVLASGNPTPLLGAALQQFAHHVGLVFQMQDDYLDRYSTTETLGKGRASDAANEKITFANIYSQEGLSQQITEHFNLAYAALNPFAERAGDLRQLISGVEHRMHAFPP